MWNDDQVGYVAMENGRNLENSAGRWDASQDPKAEPACCGSREFPF